MAIRNGVQLGFSELRNASNAVVTRTGLDARAFRLSRFLAALADRANAAGALASHQKPRAPGDGHPSEPSRSTPMCEWEQTIDLRTTSLGVIPLVASTLFEGDATALLLEDAP